ncbi:hypothetical protein FO059_18010 (plasmid) [Tomitella fengzijianii]|uniref:Uncharacterized protein n=1 Tax=Tomitella fengzijianii TaxID=2597660 RepID=A0A516X8U0_9ACTN|nr:hypothetical protein [Tomitella fengzijianii]QDQ99495.1 hypothetical protein FO059_18010 [Tomitella fengzijianii]
MRQNTHTSYTPATIPYDMYGTLIAVLLTAADIAATEPHVTDALAMAAFRTSATPATYRTAERAAIRTATARITPTNSEPGHLWSTWQNATDEPWPILADTAARIYGPDDAACGITPGHWTTTTEHH